MANKKLNKLTIDISHRSIVFAILFLVFLYFLSSIISILIGVFVSFLLVVAISPLVDYLENKKIPRGLSAMAIIVLVLVLVTGTIASLISPLIAQTQILINRLPELVERLTPYQNGFFNFSPNLNSGNVSGNVLKLALNTFSGLITFFTLLVVSFYLLQDKPRWKDYLSLVFGKQSLRYYHTLTQLELKLGSWVRGMLTLMISVGLLNYLGFALIGLPNAIPLALIAGILEIVPNIGPTIAAFPAAIVGFSISPTYGFLAIFVSIVAQQLENNILVPKIMQRAVGIHPVITIISLLIGYKLGGAVLAILSLPIVLTIQVIATHLHFNSRTHKAKFD